MMKIGRIVRTALWESRRWPIVAIVLLEIVLWETLRRNDALEWMLHVPLLLAAGSMVFLLRGGRGSERVALYLGIALILVGGMTFLSGGLIIGLGGVGLVVASITIRLLRGVCCRSG